MHARPSICALALALVAAAAISCDAGEDEDFAGDWELSKLYGEDYPRVEDIYDGDELAGPKTYEGALHLREGGGGYLELTDTFVTMLSMTEVVNTIEFEARLVPGAGGAASLRLTRTGDGGLFIALECGMTGDSLSCTQVDPEPRGEFNEPLEDPGWTFVRAQES